MSRLAIPSHIEAMEADAPSESQTGYGSRYLKGGAMERADMTIRRSNPRC